MSKCDCSLVQGRSIERRCIPFHELIPFHKIVVGYIQTRRFCMAQRLILSHSPLLCTECAPQANHKQGLVTQSWTAKRASQVPIFTLEDRSSEWMEANRTIENIKIQHQRACFILCSLLHIDKLDSEWKWNPNRFTSLQI